MEKNSIILNRIAKNHKRLKKWLEKSHIEAYRLYDKDIPEYPYIIDVYQDKAVVYEKGKNLEDIDENILKAKQHQSDIFSALQNVLDIERKNIFLKQRKRQKGKDQYEVLGESNHYFTIKENGHLFWINLQDYLDTGLFLDHRPLRELIISEVANKNFLNLFAYTGSFSVVAAKAGAKTTTVDMSNTYLNWAKENFLLNEIDVNNHRFIKADTFKFLENDISKYDVIFCDPPSFSNSKTMEQTFDVQRDHGKLINLCMEKLNKDGVLYFSNNLRSFKIDPELCERFKVKDISLKTIPRDFSDLKIHQCFSISYN